MVLLFGEPGSASHASPRHSGSLPRRAAPPLALFLLALIAGQRALSFIVQLDRAAGSRARTSGRTPAKRSLLAPGTARTMTKLSYSLS